MPSKPSKTSIPKDWPLTLPYLTTQTLSPSLSPTALLTLRTRPADLPLQNTIPANEPLGPSPLVRITPIPLTSTHPAAGQAGLFAAKNLLPGTFILRYLGVVHASPLPGKEDEHANSDYDLSLDRIGGLGIDAAKSGNEARFINDYRGVPGREGRKANAEFRECWDVRKWERGMGVWVLGGGGGKNKEGKGIRKGEEILVSYGRGFWGARIQEEEWESEEAWGEETPRESKRE